MKVLLDTHIVLRWLAGVPFPKRVSSQIERADSLLVSMVTPWELMIKACRHPDQRIISSSQLSSGLDEIGARLLHIQPDHIERLASLPDHHHDPFDRMIIAQAIEEKALCISCDERFTPYEAAGLNLLWKQ